MKKERERERERKRGQLILHERAKDVTLNIC